MKKIIALLLSVVILTQTLCLNAVDADAKPQAVQIPCQYAIVDDIKTGTVNGYLIDGSFYVDLSVVEMLTGFTASQKDAETVLWKDGSSVFYRLNPESGQIIRMASTEVRWNVEIKRLDDGKQVINFEEILRAMNVQIAIDENSNYPLCTYLPYTVHDAWRAFSSLEYRPNLFSWTEIQEDQGENADPQTLGVLSAINSLYLDYNDHFITDAIFSWWSEDILNVTEEDISDTMMEILLCLSDDRCGVFGSNQLYKTFKQDNKTIGLVSKMLKFFNIDEEFNNITSVMGKGSSLVGKELTVVDVANAISQYKAVQETQRDMLNVLFVNSPIFSSAEDPAFKHIYNAAKYLSQRVRDDGVGTTAAICDGVIDVCADVLAGAIANVTPVLVLEKTTAAIMKTVPGLSDLTDINKRIHVGCLSWALLELSVYNYNDCVDNIRNYTFPSTEDMTRLKLVMLFEIMASLTARENFIKTKVIKEETVKSMEQKNKKLIELYTMVISSKPITAPADNSGMIDWDNLVYTDFEKYESKITADYLKSLLHTVVGSAEIADFCMADFDCNGSLEAFAAVVCDDKNYYDEALYDLYFVTEKNVEKISEDDWLEFHENNLLDFGNKKYYVVENCFTSSSTSRVYGVEEGVWFEEPSITRRGGWITQITETNSMTIINDFDYDGQSQNGNGTYGHTWKTHYIYWDNGFKEYGGIHISESQLLMCDGAKQYVDMIKDSNGEISGILYRENGVININYCLNSADGTTFYENMTLKLDGAKVTAVVRKDWTDSIEKYSEGGVYSEAFIPEIASYPDSFIFSIAESTPSSGQCGDTMYWKYDKDSETLEISGSGDMYDYKYTTPYEYGYNPPWYYWSQNERISNIKFNGEINEIGIGAFCYCEDIETISLPAGIKHIDEGAFDMCEGLKYVSLPEGLDTIGKDAFLLCRKLSEIHLPKSLNYIDQGAFNCCDSLTDVYYYGSKSDWKDIVINNDNDALLKANIHFMGPSSYLEELEIIQRGQYDENMGDSFVLPLGSRNGYIDINGNEYKHGIECWIARWNFTEEQSWAYSTFKLDGNYSKIDGKCVLIQSYNTSNFDTTLEFYGDDKLIASYHLTPDTIPFDISLDVTDVKNLTVYLADNGAVEGGTAFGLIDMSLNVN